MRYELLDCNHTLLESVLKLVGLVETGVVRDGQDLVPFLFEFLVLLAHNNSQLVSIPEVSSLSPAFTYDGETVPKVPFIVCTYSICSTKLHF